jgi:pimeloyl-ACP methyl ester carboxylesterase
MKLIMLPANGHDARDFEAVRGRLGGEAWDWPLLGAAASASAWADHVEARVCGPVVLVGHSVGGFAAARLAIRRPELVRGLVLVDSGGFVEIDLAARAFCALKGVPAVTGALEGRFARYHTKGRNEHARAMFERIDEKRRDTAYAESVAAVWRSFARPESSLRADAGRIRCPTLVVWGTRDPVIPVEVGRAIAASVPGARLVELDTGHAPFVEDPERFLDATLPFLRSLEDGVALGA